MCYYYTTIINSTVPTPGVTLTTPPSPITAGYPLTLTCTITVDNAAVDLNVVVDIVWEISTDTTPITITSTASGSVVDTLTIPIFSTRYTGVTCRASVRRPSDDPFVITSSQGLASVDITVRVESKCVDECVHVHVYTDPPPQSPHPLW